MDIKIIESGKIFLVGYTANTKNGFAVIGECARQFGNSKDKITNRSDANCLIDLHDYTNFSGENEQPSFNFYAVAEVADLSAVPDGMITKELPASKYAIFSFFGNPQDSLQPVSDYIYKEWFPKSTCKFNEHAMYDFVKNFEPLDKDGNGSIEYWVPIL